MGLGVRGTREISTGVGRSTGLLVTFSIGETIASRTVGSSETVGDPDGRSEIVGMNDPVGMADTLGIDDTEG